MTVRFSLGVFKVRCIDLTETFGSSFSYRLDNLRLHVAVYLHLPGGNAGAKQGVGKCVGLGMRWALDHASVSGADCRNAMTDQASFVYRA